MRLILATLLAASVMSSALAADLSASGGRELLARAGINPGTSLVVDGEKKTITSVRVLHGLRRGDFVVHIHIEEGPRSGGRQAGEVAK